MRCVRLAAVAVLITASCGDDGPSWPADAARSVVTLDVQRCDRPNRFSGFGVRLGDEVIVTAAHTVEGELRDLRVDGEPATVTAMDPRTDLAVVRVPGDSGPSAELAPVAAITASPPRWLITVDDEGAHATTVTAVRPTRLTVHDTTERRRLERDAIAFAPAVDDGTSGAPLVTGDGGVAGIVVLSVRERGLSYAVSAQEILAVLARRDEGTLDPPPSCA